MRVNFGRIIRHPILFWRSLSPFNLSHHPDCEPFSCHCMSVRGRQLCIGCFIGFPTTSVTLVVLIAFSSLGIRFSFDQTFLIGLVIVGITLLVKSAYSSGGVSVKVGLKIVEGIGFAFIFFAPLTLGVSLLVELFLLLIFWSLGNMLVGALRMYEIGKTCDSCKYRSNWGKCPGFKRVVKKLHEAGFLIS